MAHLGGRADRGRRVHLSPTAKSGVQWASRESDLPESLRRRPYGGSASEGGRVPGRCRTGRRHASQSVGAAARRSCLVASEPGRPQQVIRRWGHERVRHAASRHPALVQGSGPSDRRAEGPGHRAAADLDRQRSGLGARPGLHATARHGSIGRLACRGGKRLERKIRYHAACAPGL